MTNSPNKVLIVTYYWPPSGGSGVQRWLKFVKYLPEYGWHPYVFTPQNPAFSIDDQSLQKNVPNEAEVIRFPIWEPYEIFFNISKFFPSKKKSGKPVDFVNSEDNSFFRRTIRWIRGNIFIPDPRVFWVKPSVKFLHDFIRDNNIHTVITTGPPHSMHLIGYNLKKKSPGLHWIADFRDPWSEWGLLDTLQVTPIVRRIHKRLEKRILRSADVVTTITPFYVRQFEALAKRDVYLLTNGYDEEDFIDIQLIRPEKFTIRHIGIINEKCDPRSFMLALTELLKEDFDFANNLRLEFIGEVNSDFKNFVLTLTGLRDHTYFISSVPHRELLSIYGSSSLLLLILVGYKDAEGYMPGKLFEYVATGLPVLGVGPVNGDAAALLNESGSGQMIDGQDTASIKRVVKISFENWKNNIQFTRGLRGLSRYSRRGITGSLIRLLK